MGRIRSCLVAAALLASLVAGPAHAQDQPASDDSSGVRWRGRPSIQLGPLRLDLRLQLAHEWRRFDPGINEDQDIWRMRRGGINGAIGHHLDFEIERDFFRGGDWRDVFVRWHTYRQVEISAGRFKVPFGREQHVGTTRLDFAERTLASNLIAPGRDTGVMANGAFLSRGLTYEVGVFADDGDNGQPHASPSGDGEIDIGPSFAARVTTLPMRPLATTFETFRVGFAYGAASSPEGLNSLAGETLYGTAMFFEPLSVSGKRTRMGVEMGYTPGPVGLTAEWMQAREQRAHQGIDRNDLADLISTGWYTAATWLVTGEQKQGFENPRRALFDGGIGAVELALRYEHLGFESADQSAPARAHGTEHVPANSNRVWTVGVNWFANRWVRAAVNAVREEIDDSARTPQPGTSVFWSGIGRLQLAF